MAGTPPRHTGHPCAEVTYYPDRDPRPRTFRCGCGWSMSWLPDRRQEDPDQALLDGYAEHRAQQQAGYGRVRGQGWQSKPL